MQRRKFSAFLIGIAIAATMLFAASPASAESGRLFNAGPQMTGYCLATQEPYVFAYSRCSTESYADQVWDVRQWPNGYRIQSLYRHGCLTGRADASVYTYPFPCVDYNDQMWRPYRGQWGTWENVHFTGFCLAAHPNGHVFMAPCNLNYSDQYWFMNS